MTKSSHGHHALRPRTTHPGLCLEELEARAVPATASFASGVLTVTCPDCGDHDLVTVTRQADGTITVADQDGAVAVSGGTPTVANTTQVDVRVSSLADLVALDATAGAFTDPTQPDPTNEIKID